MVTTKARGTLVMVEGMVAALATVEAMAGRQAMVEAMTTVAAMARHQVAMDRRPVDMDRLTHTAASSMAVCIEVINSSQNAELSRFRNKQLMTRFNMHRFRIRHPKSKWIML